MRDAAHAASTAYPAGRNLAVEASFVAALTLICVVFGERIIAHPLHAAALAVLPVMIWLLVTHPKAALYLAVAGIVMAEEFELGSTEAFFESGIDSSVLALRIFGVNIIDAVTLLFFAPAAIRAWTAWRYGDVTPWRGMDRYFIPILAVYAFGALQGMFNALSFGHFSWEARDILYILAWYFIASRTLENRDDVVRLLAVLLGVFSLKSLLFLGRLAAGKGLFYGFDFYRPALGADVSMMALPLLAVFAALALAKDARPCVKALLIVLLAYWSMWLIGSLGRAVYLTTTAAFIVLALSMRGSIRPAHVLPPLFAVVSGALAFYFLALTEAHRELISTMLGTAFNWVDAVTVYEDRSMGQRILEFMNISEVLTRSGAWLHGLGWGAPWSETAAHMPLDRSAFDIMESIRGIHTSAHVDALYFLLKVGIIGTIVIYATYARFVADAVRIFKRSDDVALRIAMAAVVTGLIVFLPNYVYFVKLKLILGIFFGCLCVVRGPEPAR